jgi:putative DNA topoisomerase
VGKSTFLSCARYPECTYTQSFASQDVTTLKRIDDSQCPDCESTLAVKKGRYGMFIGCTNFPSCHFISTTHNAKKTASYTPVKCPACGEGDIQKKQNRFGKFFFACDNYPHCKKIYNAMPLTLDCEKCGSHIVLTDAKRPGIVICANAKCGQEFSRENE